MWQTWRLGRRGYVDSVLNVGALLKHVTKGAVHNLFNTYWRGKEQWGWAGSQSQTIAGVLSLEPGPVLYRTCPWVLEGCWKKTGVKCIWILHSLYKKFVFKRIKEVTFWLHLSKDEGWAGEFCWGKRCAAGEDRAALLKDRGSKNVWADVLTRT